MIGAVIGDVIGSYYEFRGEKGRELNLMQPASSFTDDTILTAAVASAILENEEAPDYQRHIVQFASRYQTPNSNGPTHVTPSFGQMFSNWLLNEDDLDPSDYSYGNGASMRTIPVAWAYNDLDRVIDEARKQASITHKHPLGMNGAVAVALAGFLFRQGAAVDDVQMQLKERCGISTALDLDQLHRTYEFDSTAAGSVPVAIVCAIRANSFEEVMRNVLYVGGDTDTIGAMAGGIAEFRFGVPDNLRRFAMDRVERYADDITETIERFRLRYCR
jgi:ADP-ribosylglycohydrolase